MESEFDTVRDNYDSLAAITFDDPERQQEYTTSLNILKQIADALTDQRTTFPIDSMSDASSSFSPDMPSDATNCEQIYNSFINKTDPDDPEYDALHEKANTIQAMIYIHWRFNELSPEDPSSPSPSKLSFTQTIIKKLVRCTLQWSTSLHTTKENFMQMNEDLRDNKPIAEILDNFNLHDLQCYGY